MKKLILFVFLALISAYSFAQRSTGIVISQGVTNPTPNPPNMVWVDTVGATNYNWKLARKDSLKFFPWNIPWIGDSVISIGNARYAQLSVPYSNPVFVNTLSAAKVFGLSSVAVTGNYSDLSGTPNLSLYYLNSNPLGFISSVSFGDVIGALGYVPPPNTRVLSINGIPQDLSANRSWSIYPDTTIIETVYRTDTMRSRINSSLEGKEPIITSGTAAQYWAGTKTWQTLNTAAVAESPSFLYFTTSRAQDAISLTTSGTGAATYVGGTLNIPTPPALVTWSFNNAPGRSIVTNASAANGFQVSSTRPASIRYSVTINTTVSLSGSAVGYVVLEICPTNSATAGDWIEISRVPSGQSGSLVIGLTLNQVGGGCMSADLPTGYYARIRSVNTTGTPTYTYNSGQEVLK